MKARSKNRLRSFVTSFRLTLRAAKGGVSKDEAEGLLRMRRFFGWRLVLAASLSLLTACSSVLPQRGPAPDLYQLSPVYLKSEGKTIPAQIIVETPLAARGLDTDRIVVRSDPYAVKYLSGARWADRAPRLVQSALIQGLESAGAFAGVGRPEDGLRSTYALLSDLRAFDVLSGGFMGGTKVQVVLAAKLVRSPGGEVIASKLMTQEADVKGSGHGAVVAAFDEAVKAVAAEAAEWIVANAAQLPSPATPAPSPSASAGMPPVETATP